MEWDIRYLEEIVDKAKKSGATHVEFRADKNYVYMGVVVTEKESESEYESRKFIESVVKTDTEYAEYMRLKKKYEDK